MGCFFLKSGVTTALLGKTFKSSEVLTVIHLLPGNSKTFLKNVKATNQDNTWRVSYRKQLLRDSWGSWAQLYQISSSWLLRHAIQLKRGHTDRLPNISADATSLHYFVDWTLRGIGTRRLRHLSTVCERYYSLNEHHLDDDLLLHAFSTVDPLNDMVRATVLDDSVSDFDFPFEHADHKLSIKQELSTAIWNGCRETERKRHIRYLIPLKRSSRVRIFA